MKVIFISGGMETESSGVTRIMCDLANSLVQAKIDIPIYTATRRSDGAYKNLLDNPESCIDFSAKHMFRLSPSAKMKAGLESIIPKVDVVHNHSVWMLPNAYASKIARRVNKPVIFSTYGYFEPWALAHSRWKKFLVEKWFQRKDLDDATCLHAASEREIEGIRKFGLTNPVAVVPNGVYPEIYESLPASSIIIDHAGLSRARKKVLFLARLHPKKGVSNLINAWAQIARLFNDWELVIAGPDDGAESKCRAIINEHSLHDSVKLIGQLDGNKKLSAYAASDIFILPSHSEGFSNSVLEAMASGLPVIISEGCNFPEALACGAAIETTCDIDGIASTMKILMNMTSEERNTIGNTGKKLIEKNYSWPGLAEKMKQVYEWMAAGASKPDFIIK